MIETGFEPKTGRSGVSKEPDVSQAVSGNSEIKEVRLLLSKSLIRNEQLKAEIEARRAEYDQINSQNLKQNEELIKLNRELSRWNQELDAEVLRRTAELEESKKMLEEKSEALKELGEMKEALTHMIVHDMKNPLTVILGNLALAKNERFSLEPILRQAVSDSHQQALKLLHMIEEILFISRMQSKEFQLRLAAVDLGKLVRQCADTMAKTIDQKKITIQCEVLSDSDFLEADGEVLERIINNLLNNSIKYAPVGSVILVETARGETYKEVVITNWGDPIPKEYHEKIFDLFSRVNTRDKQLSGTGLGLAFCKIAVEAHAGKIRVVSPVLPESKGVRFHIRLPIRNSSEAGMV